MEPRIQYTQTADGVSIAYWTLGEGCPYSQCRHRTRFSHIQPEWQLLVRVRRVNGVDNLPDLYILEK